MFVLGHVDAKPSIPHFVAGPSLCNHLGWQAFILLELHCSVPVSPWDLQEVISIDDEAFLFKEGKV
jgi:hypothetical protein